jgi:hypothetical protein
MARSDYDILMALLDDTTGERPLALNRHERRRLLARLREAPAAARAAQLVERARQKQRLRTGGRRMLVGGMTHRKDIPHEPGEYMEFRMLSAVDLDAAEAAAVAGYSRQARAMGAELMTALQQAATTDTGPTRPAVRYDATTLIELALVAWSYPAPLTAESIRRLDLRTRDWARDEVIALHFPDADPVLAEAATKNGSSASTAGLMATVGAGRNSRGSSGGSVKSSTG